MNPATRTGFSFCNHSQRFRPFRRWFRSRIGSACRGRIEARINKKLHLDESQRQEFSRLLEAITNLKTMADESRRRMIEALLELTDKPEQEDIIRQIFVEQIDHEMKTGMEQLADRTSVFIRSLDEEQRQIVHTFLADRIETSSC